MPEHSPKIPSFAPNRILRLDGEFIDLSVTSPQELRHIVDTHEDLIDEQIERIFYIEQKNARKPETRTRQTIQIARLATKGSERNAFQSYALPDLARIHTTHEVLNARSLLCWNELANTNFRPEIVLRLGRTVLEGTEGTWIGVASTRQ